MGSLNQVINQMMNLMNLKPSVISRVWILAVNNGRN